MRHMLLLAFLCAACSPLPPADLVCARPEVLRALDTELHGQGIYGKLDTRSVGEVTGVGASAASCSIRISVRGYDTNAYGLQPVEHWEVRGYEVLQLRAGLMVRLLR